MNPLSIRRHPIALAPDSSRVIVRPYIPSSESLVRATIQRALALSEEEVAIEVKHLHDSFESRHLDIESPLLTHYSKVGRYVDSSLTLSKARILFIGALFSGEYAFESAALFNPSIVPHPDQSNVPAGGLRFIMSLRATGEGHISSIEFREGMISPNGGVDFKEVSRVVTLPQLVPNPIYQKQSFTTKLREMGFVNDTADAVLAPLSDRFTRSELGRSVAKINGSDLPTTHESVRTLECIKWLADSNYELRFSPEISLGERVIFPVSANESNGIEDARFVRLTEDDGRVIYCATYTAYNGRVILPQLIETQDFLHFHILTLNGNGVQNKGMALFPRTIHGRYAMLSRQDDENILIMYSDNLHYWSDPVVLVRPSQPWEFVKLGNCGSPLETKDGWLVITHGVGPMRTYRIGAVLLDIDDPSKVIGRLREPLLSAEGIEREGYVPNVVYSCGSLIHGDNLILPYAMSDKAASVATISVSEILAKIAPSKG